ncbi:hypothetical protein AB0K80_02055 [Streptomyces sp. NPDC052682]|uniref:hypothetical protein n=1 Tax=Streptomyces sp. NPDC052682 TaxID=3154954 RepID=UPI00342780D5
MPVVGVRAAVGLVTVLAVAVLAGCGTGSGGTDARSSTDAGSRSDSGGQRVPYWVKGVGFTRVAQDLGVTVPRTATQRLGARQKGFQDDVLLLAFVLPAGEVDGFVDGLDPEHQPVHRKRAAAPAGYEPTAPFAHLGLAEPETLDGVTAGQVCAPCDGELDSLDITVAPAGKDRSRIYLRGID